jgi:beta-lactamase superfamily II metal-dependent hydrolase
LEQGRGAWGDTATIFSARQVAVLGLLTCLLACSPIGLEISPTQLPDTGSNRLELRFLDASNHFPSGTTTVQVAGHDLLVQQDRGSAGYFVALPKLPVGRHALTIDGEESTAELEVYEAHMLIEFIDVGQGDATLIVGPSGLTALVDSGPPGSGPVLLERLNAHGISHLDLVILTHADADHIGGLVELPAGLDGLEGSADDITIKQVYEDGSLADRQTLIAQQVNGLLDSLGNRIVPNPGLVILGLGGFSIEFLAVAGATRNTLGSDEARANSNARSIVNKVCLEGWCGLLSGDLTGGGLGTPDVETNLSLELEPVIWVKVPHHGSRSSSNSAFVQTTQPRLAVFSLGDDNDFCHPAPEPLSRWARTATLLSTGVGQSGQGGCDATEWPLGSQTNCGSIVVQKGAKAHASVSCADSTLSL